MRRLVSEEDKDNRSSVVKHLREFLFQTDSRVNFNHRCTMRVPFSAFFSQEIGAFHLAVLCKGTPKIFLNGDGREQPPEMDIFCFVSDDNTGSGQFDGISPSGLLWKVSINLQIVPRRTGTLALFPYVFYATLFSIFAFAEARSSTASCTSPKYSACLRTLHPWLPRLRQRLHFAKGLTITGRVSVLCSVHTKFTGCEVSVSWKLHDVM